MPHRRSWWLAFVASAALICSSSATALGQEEDPGLDDSTAEETRAGVVEPSTLEIIDIAGAKTAGQPLKGKKLKKAMAKAAPVAARYVIGSTGDDAIDQIIGLSLAARAADEAGDAKLAKAYIDVATLLYRNEWTKSKSDPLALNQTLEEAASAAYPQGHPALVQAALPQDGLYDLCLVKSGSWFYNPQTPSLCENDGGGRMARVDETLVDESKNGQPGVYSGDFENADVGGVGIHKIVQHKTAETKLPGKKYDKALGKALQESGPAIAGYEPGERGVIEMVLAARAADEAGNQKAAKAYMQLALAAYRSGVQKPDETDDYDPAYQQSIDQLIREEYEGLPGLELYPPEGMTDACFDRKGKFVACVDPNSPFECYGAGGSRLERLTLEETNDCEG